MSVDLKKICEENIEILNWFKEKYENKNLPLALTNIVQKYWMIKNYDKEYTVEIEETQKKLENYSKAIRQDLNKILFKIKAINDFYDIKIKNNSDISRLDNSFLGMDIEYIIIKYRGIIELVLKVMEIVYQHEKIHNYEEKKQFLEHLQQTCKGNNKILNIDWFKKNILNMRNTIIHDGAGCICMFGETGKLFKICTLDLEDVICEKYLTHPNNDNCICFDNFTSTYLAHLVYFIDDVFNTLIKDISNSEDIFQNLINTTPFGVMLNNELNQTNEYQDSLFNSINLSINNYENKLKKIQHMYI